MFNVLLVEDEDAYIRDFTRQLRANNFCPVVATDYKVAMQTLHNTQPLDLILFDLRLAQPEGDRTGTETAGLKFLKEMRSKTRTPIIVLSSKPGVDEASIRAGAELSMQRPKNPEALQDVIESILIRYQMQNERNSCFISYSHHDEAFARRLHDDLKQNEVQCWYAPHDLPIGAKTRNAIHLAIESHDKLLIILSQHSVQSDWVEDEVAKALELESNHKRLILFPIRIDDAVLKADSGWPATIRNTRNVGDFTMWQSKDKQYSEQLKRLLRDLKKT